MSGLSPEEPENRRRESDCGQQGSKGDPAWSNPRRVVRSHPPRDGPSLGRRRTDYDPRTTISKKLLVVTVFLIDALYLAGQSLLWGVERCP